MYKVASGLIPAAVPPDNYLTSLNTKDK